ncbi:glycosyltransferase family protein [Sideroxydans sp.]
MRRIILYFPYRGVGGVSLLFQRLSGYLVGLRKVFLVDFHDGFMAKSTPKGVELVNFDTVTHYPSDAVLVVQSLSPWNIRDADKFDDDTRVLFWNLHPLNFYPYIFSLHSANRWKALVAKLLMPLSIFRRRKLARIVQYLSARNALVFMDGENYERTSAFFPGSIIHKRLLPILSPAGKQSNKELGRELQCCWIGRIVDFKLHILLHLIGRLDEATSIAGPIHMTVVGDGESLEHLKAEAVVYENIKLTFVPNVPPDQLDDFIGKHVDVLFGMGTSALEGASRSVPTILLDYSYYPIKGLYRFKYIFEAADYSLAELIQEERHMEQISTFWSKLLEIRTNNSAIRQSCYNYWLQHYSPEAVTQSFLSHADGTTATIGEMRRLGLFHGDRVSLTMKKTLRIWKTPNSNHGFLEN